MTARTAEIAVIGGTGMYSLLGDGERVEVSTPYGSPSSAIALHEVAGHRVAFLPRHGDRHQHPAHQVPYRANLWALASLGVRRVLAPSAAGSLRRELPPGTLVVPDQLIDRTHGRDATFYDDVAAHVPFADPYCPQLRGVALSAITRAGRISPDTGVVVVVNGPRFGTRAEAQWFRQAGADLVNMTALPEAALARELALCYCSIATVTDWDAGLDVTAPVTQAEVLERFAATSDVVRDVLRDIVETLPADRDCACGRALDGLPVSDLGLRTRPAQVQT